MPRLPNHENNANRGRPGGSSKNDIDAGIAELFAAQPPAVDELFADPIVQKRIAIVLARAVMKPTRA
jgi:hypothetical protein